MQNRNDLKTWRLATLIVVLVAVSVFFVQRFIFQFFDIAFEVCIFYIPVFSMLGFFLYFRWKS